MAKMFFESLLLSYSIIFVVPVVKSNSLTNEIITNLKDGTDIVDDLSSYKDEQIFNTIHKMSNFMGSVNAFISFLHDYDPKTDKDTLKKMTEMFSSTNEKLEQLKGQDSKSAHLIKIFFEVRNIEFSFKLLNSFMKNLNRGTCKSKTECLQKLQETAELFKYDIDVKDHFDKMTKFVLSDTFYQNYATSNKTNRICQFHRIVNFMKRILIVSFKAEQILIVHGKIANVKFDSLKEIGHWDDLMYKIRQKMFEIITKCYSAKKCQDSCNAGQCMQWSKLNLKTCICGPYFEGKKCKIHNQIKFIQEIQSLTDGAAQIPHMKYLVNNPRSYAIIPKTCIHDAINRIRKLLQDADGKLSKSATISEKLLVFYATYFNLQYYVNEVQILISCDHLKLESKLTHLEASLLFLRRVFPKMLFKFNSLIIGQSAFSISTHKPVMLSFIKSEFSTKTGCTDNYKKQMDAFWRKIQILQLRAYITWLQINNILSLPTNHIIRLYKKRTNSQVDTMKKKTCSIKEKFSYNANCMGGFYVTQDLKLKLKCKPGYFRKGNSLVSCDNSSTSCKSCNCDKTGSASTKCVTNSGQCKCRKGFYGTKCTDRDCIWGSRTGWSSCSKNCNYGGKQTRKRKTAVSSTGNGKKCKGSHENHRSCFKGCCSGQFHCSNKKKCIPSSKKCDYNNDCGDSQDEKSGCSESCFSKYTGYTIDGSGNTIYLDRQYVSCGSSNYVMTKFRLDRKTGHVRYHITCCKMLRKICNFHTVNNGYTVEGYGKVIYLDRQPLTCPNNGFLRLFHLNRRHGGGTYRYTYQCCQPYNAYRSKISCYWGNSGAHADGSGNMMYLDRHNVQCKSRYFLSKFFLSRPSKTTIRYNFKCCRVNP